MALSQLEYDAIVANETKRIQGDMFWRSSQNPLATMFRHDIDSNEGFPLFLQGWYNPYSGKLSYAIIYRGVGRIYGLDLGAEHINPDGRAVGEDTQESLDSRIQGYVGLRAGRHNLSLGPAGRGVGTVLR